MIQNLYTIHGCLFLRVLHQLLKLRFTMLHIPPSLRDALREEASGVTVYQDPQTSQLWLHDNKEKGFTTCEYAIKMAKLLQRLDKHMATEEGYVLPPPLPSEIGKHSMFDAFGAPWRIDHSNGAVICCWNRISVDDAYGRQAQSIADRLYHQFEEVAPTNLRHALALSQRVHNATWFTMNAHKSKRQGLLSRCNCCRPPKVMCISWEHKSSQDLLRYCRQELQAWIGLPYETLPPDILCPSRLPSV